MSEFGKGLIYPLGLFLAHAEREGYRWFAGSVDHLCEIQTDNIKDEKIKERVDAFVKKCHELWRKEFTGGCYHSLEKDKKDVIQEAKNILLELDKYYGNDAEKGGYE
jgi:hypothetical protein